MCLFNPLLDKVRAKLSGWDLSRISQGGRWILLRNVISSIPIYLLQIISPAVTIVKMIDRLMSRFLWGTSDAKQKLHWASWHKINIPITEGGLGIRKFPGMSLAFDAILWFNFINNSSLWTKFFMSKYCHNRDSTTISATATISPIWRRLILIRDEIQIHIFWKLGDGNISFWHDSWTHYGPLSHLALDPNQCHGMVQDFRQNNLWNIAMLRENLPLHVVANIIQIPYGITAISIWKIIFQCYVHHLQYLEPSQRSKHVDS